MSFSLRKALPQQHFLRKWYSASQAIMAAVIFGFPARGLQIIAVTGTDGKTTVTEMIGHILRNAEIPLLSISTAAIKLDNEILPSSKRTTPSPWRINHLLKSAKLAGIKNVVLEVSSHSLCQRRIFGIRPAVAVLTNITPEHLDYHGDMESYRAAKKLLFTKLLKSNGTVVLNLDDPVGIDWQRELLQSHKHVLSYSLIEAKGTDISASNIQETDTGITFEFLEKASGKKESVTLPIKGSFNVENALAAIAAASVSGVSIQKGIEAMRSFSGVPGRMEQIETGKDFQVFVDFALTAGALTKALTSARTLAGANKVTLVFGSAGNHPDIAIRKETGKIAANLTDIVIVTDDEPYFEDPALIRSQIISGAQEAMNPELFAQKCLNIADRKEAIQKALSLGAKGDVIIISGMGHLHSRNISGKEIPWNDAQIIRECLKSLS